MLLGQLLDRGFSGGTLPLWAVPVGIIGLFTVRSLSGFLAQYGLAWVGNRAVLMLRQGMFARLLTHTPDLYTHQTASGMTNTLVYEAQAGVTILSASVLTLVRDTLILVALLATLLYLNWQLTLVVGLLIPGRGAGDARLWANACTASRSKARRPPTSWPTSSKKTCWPGASCACTVRRRGTRAAASSQPCRQPCAGLMMKAVVAGAAR